MKLISKSEGTVGEHFSLINLVPNHKGCVFTLFLVKKRQALYEKKSYFFIVNRRWVDATYV